MKKFKCILLVDDDAESTFLGKRYLTDLRIADKIHIAENGKEALDYISQCRAKNDNENDTIPELILLDINMPVMDGFEFLKEFNVIHQPIRNKIKIFMLSVSDNSDDMQRAKDYNVNGYIVKPLTKEKIVQSLLKGLFSPNQKHQNASIPYEHFFPWILPFL